MRERVRSQQGGESTDNNSPNTKREQERLPLPPNFIQLGCMTLTDILHHLSLPNDEVVVVVVTVVAVIVDGSHGCWQSWLLSLSHQRPEYCKKFLKYFNRIL